MPTLSLQLIAAIFAIFALSRVYLRFKERKLSSFSVVFWSLIWLLGVMAILFPDLTSSVARIIGIGRGVDVILYSSIVILFYLLFRIYIKMEDTQRQITQVVREIALIKIRPKRRPTKKR